jgi:hypothetical protein
MQPPGSMALDDETATVRELDRGRATSRLR